jgi:hypothetical protein
MSFGYDCRVLDQQGCVRLYMVAVSRYCCSKVVDLYRASSPDTKRGRCSLYH